MHNAEVRMLNPFLSCPHDPQCIRLALIANNIRRERVRLKLLLWLGLNRPEILDQIVSRCLVAEKYGRRRDIQTKQMKKGIEVEDDSIDLLNNFWGVDYGKNEHRFTNDYISGHPDIITVNDANVSGIAIRVGQTVFISDNATGLSNKGIVTAVNTTAGTFDVAYYEGGGQTFSGTAVLSVWIYGSEFKKGIKLALKVLKCEYLQPVISIESLKSILSFSLHDP